MSEPDIIRRGRPEDLPALAALADRVFRPQVSPGTGMSRQFPLLYSPANAANLFWVAGANGRPASLIGTLPSQITLNGAVLPVLSIGSVATRPEQRGQGFATRLLERILDEARRDYALVLVSGDRGLYLRHGCVRFGRLLRVDWELTGMGSPVTGTRLLRPEELIPFAPALHRLYRAEPYRFLRTPRQMEDLLQATAESLYRNRPGATRVWVCQARNDTVAYAVVSPMLNHSALELLEWAGDRHAVMTLAADAARAEGFAKAIWSVMPEDETFRGLLAAEHIALHREMNHGTLALVNPTRLVAELGPLIYERTGHGLQGASFPDETTNSGGNGAGDTFTPPSGVRTPAELAEWLFGPEGMDLPMVDTGTLNYV